MTKRSVAFAIMCLFGTSMMCVAQEVAVESEIVQPKKKKWKRISTSSTTTRRPAPTATRDVSAPAKVQAPNAPSVRVSKIIKKGPVRTNSSTIRVVEFWATWCPPCEKTVPALTALQKKFASKNVAVTGITSETDEALVRRFVAQKGDTMNYEVGIDPNGSTSAAYRGLFGTNTIPHAYVISHSGKILWHGNPLSVKNLEFAVNHAIQLRDQG